MVSSVPFDLSYEIVEKKVPKLNFLKEQHLSSKNVLLRKRKKQTERQRSPQEREPHVQSAFFPDRFPSFLIFFTKDSIIKANWLAGGFC